MKILSEFFNCKNEKICHLFRDLKCISGKGIPKKMVFKVFSLTYI